jgi:hypothetical protein
MRQSIVSLMAGLLIGAVIVYFQFPRIETKIEVQKETETQTRTVTRRVVLPDGTKTTERITDTVKKENENTLTLTKSQSKWRAGVDVKASLTNLVPQYGATVGYRAFGPVWVEASGYQDGTAVVRAVWEF